jgi:hypothetical protein
LPGREASRLVTHRRNRFRSKASSRGFASGAAS